MLYGLLSFAVLPPGNLLVAALLAQLFRRRAWARNVTSVCVVLLYALSTPLVATALIGGLETYPALTALPVGPAAIVVLSAESRFAPEYGTESAGELTLGRLRYAAALHRRTGLPVLATGGVYGSLTVPIAAAMGRTLEDEFKVEPVWIEPRARDTWENAMYSAPILAAHGIRDVFLVTSAFHMKRAMAAFADAGIGVTPAPTGFYSVGAGSFGVLPQPRSLQVSYYAIHEWVGIAYYAGRRLLLSAVGSSSHQ